jgi:hypothetical protein
MLSGNAAGQDRPASPMTVPFGTLLSTGCRQPRLRSSHRRRQSLTACRRQAGASRSVAVSTRCTIGDQEVEQTVMKRDLAGLMRQAYESGRQAGREMQGRLELHRRELEAIERESAALRQRINLLAADLDREEQRDSWHH